jgi:hypothetical protein
MTFDSLLGFFDGGEPSPLIPDDDVMCFLARPESGVRCAATDALWAYQDKTTFWRKKMKLVM